MNMLAILLAMTAAAQSARIVDVNPSTVYVSGGTITVQFEGPLVTACGSIVAQCYPEATIGGVAVPAQGGTVANSLVVHAPAHAAGAVELKLKAANGSGAEATATIHYADVSDWESLLL